MPNCEEKGNVKMDLGLNDKESLIMDSHAAIAAQNDEVREWAQNDKTGYIPNTIHTEELSPSYHTEEFSPFCHTEERSDVSIHNDVNSESGRSMIEILGVLAVIGILSITAITGYRYAMNKNEANRIISGLAKAQLTIADVMHSGNEDIFLSEDDIVSDLSYDVLSSGHDLEKYEPVAAACAEQSFDVVLSNIPVDICKFLVDEGVGAYYAVDVRNDRNNNYDQLCRELKNANTSCQSESGFVQIAFAFEGVEDIKPVSMTCTTDLDCLNGCYSCESGVCEERTDCSNGCGWLSGGIPGTKDTFGCCPDDAPLCGGYCCPSGYSCKNKRCVDSYSCPPGQPLKAPGSGNTKCHSCYEGQPIDVSDYYSPAYYKGLCEKACGGIRELTTDEEYCILSECDGVRATDNTCHACDSTATITVESPTDCNINCPDRQIDANGKCVLPVCTGFSGKNGSCYACDYPDAIYATLDECQKCSGRTMNGNYCTLSECKNGFVNSSGSCILCNDPSKVANVKKTECDKCGNREWNNLEYTDKNLGVCLPEKCSGIYASYHGKCFPCDYEGVITTYSKYPEVCAICPNREIVAGSSSSYSSCVLKCDEIRSSDGKCYTCDAEDSFKATAEECSRCPNREMTSDGKYCVLACDGVLNSSKTCMPCNTETAITVTNPEDCTKNCGNRSIDANGKCVITSCKGVIDKTGNCRPCDYTGNISVATAEDCTKNCPTEREMFTYTSGSTTYEYCVLANCDGMRRLNGTCISCDATTLSGMVGISEEECKKCSNREMWLYNPNTGSASTTQNRCIIKTDCKEGEGFRKIDGSCVPCDSPDAPEVKPDSTDCAKCPGRTIVVDDYWWDRTHCGFIDCGPGKFRDTAGKCHSCDDPALSIQTLKEQCDKCPNRRMTDDGDNDANDYCVICDGMVEEYKHECYPCDINDRVDVLDNECNRCPERGIIAYWFSGGEQCGLVECGDDFLDANGYCRPCNYSNTTATKVQCDKCPNRVSVGSQCNLCGVGYYNPNQSAYCQPCPNATDVDSEILCTHCKYTWNSRKGICEN